MASFIFFFFLCSLNGFSQQIVKYHIVGTAVTGTNIRCIAEDKRRFIWVGTQDGLSKYDSKSTRDYNQKGTYKNNIGGSDIRAICTAKDLIWITSTVGGLDAISSATSNPVIAVPQSRFAGLGTNAITSLARTDTALYVGTEKGLYVYDIRQDRVLPLPVPGFINPLFIDKLFIVGHYLVMLIRDLGCLCFDIRAGKVTDFVNTLRACHIRQHRFYSVAESPDGSWLLATSSGISRIAVGNTGVLHFGPAAFAWVPESCAQDVYGIAVDKRNHIWFSTENYLLNIDSDHKKYSFIENALENSTEFLNNIYTIYCDDDDGIWLGCQAGLFYLKNMAAPTITYFRSARSVTRISHAYYIYPAGDTTLLVTGENGLYKINTRTSDIQELDNTQPYDFVFTDPFGRLLVSNKTGLKYMHGGSFTGIEQLYPEFAPFSDVTINSAIPIGTDEIVMGTENNRGVLIWNLAKHTLTNITTTSQGLRLDNNAVNTVFRVQANAFCVLTESSLIYIDLERDSSRRIHLIKNKSGEEYGLLFDMCRVKDRYYLSSYGNGVLEMDTSFVIRRLISTAGGLSNNSVYKLLPWKDSLLFMTTNYGINILNVKNNVLKKLFKSDGLNDNVFEETSGCIYRNTVFAGGLNGLTAIYPDNIIANTKAPYLYINELSIALPGSVVSDTTNLEASHFSIPDNALQTKIFFSAINFSNPARTRFAYRITELHKDWIDLGSQDFITLIGLGPGKYHLLVKAANEDGIWSASRGLELRVEPKWYQTWLFKILVSLAMLALFYSFYLYRIRQINKLHEIRKNIATDLHDSLGSSLTSIKVFTNLAISGIDSPRNLLQVKESISQAAVALRDLIWVLDDSLDTVDELVTRLKQYALPVSAASNINTVIKADFNAGILMLTKAEKRNLFLLCKEVINNSIKYAGATEINVAITTAGKKIQIVLSDNGKGFDPGMVKKGYGLRNIGYRAEQIKYKAVIDSMPGKGTRVLITPY